MSIFGKMVNALYRERHSVTFEVTVPAQMYMAMETLIYLRNESSEGSGKAPVDRDLIVGLALSHFLTEHLTRNEEKIKAIPPAPPRVDQYTTGRRQLRSPTYASYQEANP